MKLEYKLPPSFKKRWLTALRSGKYKQGYKQLCNGEAHCCLGVLYEVMGGTWTKEGGDYSERMTHTTLNNHSTILCDGDAPVSVIRVLHQHIGSTRSCVDNMLIGMNDSKKSFKRIANWIEKYL